MRTDLRIRGAGFVRRNLSCSIAACAFAAACGPRPGAGEVTTPGGGLEPRVEADADFLETFALPPEVLAALAAQRELVVPEPAPIGEVEYRFPQVSKGKLANGMEWYIVENDALPIVSLNLVVRAGSSYDPAGLPGLAVFTGDMLNEGGTAKRTPAVLAADIEKLGADLTILTGMDYTMVAVDGLSDASGELVKLISEMAMEPAFPQDEIDKQRSREISRLDLARSDPEWIADSVFFQRLYGSHPYSRYDTTREALDAIRQDDVKAFHGKHYVGRNAFFVAVGDIDEKVLVKLLDSTLGKMPKGARVKLAWPALPPRTAREIVIVDRPGSAQTVVRVGRHTLRAGSEDAVPLTVANHVLGGNASSRLFLELREDKGLTYGAYSAVPMLVDVGSFFVETSTKTQSTGESLAAIFAEVGKVMSQDPDAGAVGADELLQYQNYLAGIMPIQAQTPSRVADMLIDRIVFGLAEDHYDTYPGKVMAVTPGVVSDMARKYLDTAAALVVLVGDANAIREQVQTLGSVEVVTWQ